MQMSWLVLSRVSTVTHAVLNSLRRPVICLFGFLQFGGHLSFLNFMGISMASGGALLYGHIKRTELARVKAKGSQGIKKAKMR
jgi:solute carrier family 35 protein E1